MEGKIGIICATDRELDPLLKHMEDASVTKKSKLKIHEGIIGDLRIVALFSGVGKVNSAIATQMLIDNYSINAIINTGVAGGMDYHIKPFDTIVSTEATYHDANDDILTDFHPWMPSIYFPSDKLLLNLLKRSMENNRSRHNIYFGKVVTGDQFIEGDMREKINKKHGSLAVDMETASIAHACYVNEVPFISIRTITDTEMHDGTDNVERNFEDASKISIDITLKLLKGIKS